MNMKKIFILLMGLTIAVVSACKKEKLATVSSNVAAPVLTSPADGTAITVRPADTAQLLNITWTKSDYGVSAVVDYFVQADSAGKNFSKYVTLGNVTSKDTLSLSYSSLNSQLLNGLNLAPNAASTVEVRVGSAIYGKDTVYSKPVKLSITTYLLIRPAVNQLWLPGSYEGYKPAAAPTIPATAASATAYEGYAYFSAQGNFKFTSAPDYDHIIYGDGGNGTLTTAGNPADIVFPSAGVYKLNADVKNLTYSAVFIQSFGIIGTATPGQWNNSTPMTYNSATGLWTVTAALTQGALKFRANDAWDINYGPGDANSLAGTLVFNDPGAININNAGTYTITIDMTQSKSQTYTYTVVKN
jgi:hypothetical protein